ncbi:HD domain-containing phosphohydrolase [Pelagicoccus sp. SDUM812003]|uniref:HD domain-containing phosphohydrolase n=1 Tax=Pelagicoccus sp. SDUM812003 TaxID=3041267 RepID=UPI00280D8335|nr:HD domain-containing phosphohydrolase [Pelagicoccus sp. SDUM812003]MDQ8202578.1 response regulator [Pelagicoccus sp. SDUM812003]
MKVLFVDDNKSVLAAFRRNLRKRYDVATAEGAAEALRMLENDGPFDIIVSDMKMPGMDGVSFLEKTIEISPGSVRIMLTGNAEQDTPVEAVNRGHVYKFLNKPCSVDDLVVALKEAEGHHKVQQVEQQMLEQTVSGCVKVLTDVLGLVAPFALGRGQRLKDCLVPFLKVIKLKGLWQYEVAALLSSVGYTSVPSELILKLERGQKLNVHESSVIRKIPEIGYELVSAIPRLERVAKMIRYQRKSYNGSGFPEDNVSEQSIPLGARLLRVFEDRIDLERDGISGQAAFDIMSKSHGLYDPKILGLCFKYYPNYLTTSISKDKDVLTVDLKSLKPGMCMVSDLSTKDGILLVEAGNWLTGATIQRIRNYHTLEQVDGPFYVQLPDEA